MEEFDALFKHFTGYPPLLWQRDLFERLINGEQIDAIDLPTGLGKTSVVTIWLIAKLLGAKLPRRLIYVVDRRAVVDQASAEAERIKARLEPLLEQQPLLRETLGLPGELPVSTLRGQLADNRRWLEDPASPAIIIGTVDMIGSRLLFSGYGVGRYMRPYHAALLGIDTWLVLDEAHLSQPFEYLVRSVAEFIKDWALENGLSTVAPAIQLLPLSATPRSHEGHVLRLPEGEQDTIVQMRLGAKKSVSRHHLPSHKEVDIAQNMAARAAELAGASGRVVVFCDTRRLAQRVYTELGNAKKYPGKPALQLLVGARRVYEREAVRGWLMQHGFMQASEEDEVEIASVDQPAILIATAAGEVGVDMNAEHMVCDLVPWERMVQRFGRVNRYGDGDAHIEVCTWSPGKIADHEIDVETLWRPFEFLPELSAGIDASPGAILALRDNEAAEQAISEATSAPVRCPVLHRAIVETWALTAIPDHAARPFVAPWLRGWMQQSPQTQVVWRRHIPLVAGEDYATQGWIDNQDELNRYFSIAPPHRLEILETESNLVKRWLNGFVNAWWEQNIDDVRKRSMPLLFVLNRANEVVTRLTAAQFRNASDGQQRTWIEHHTVVVHAALGGLQESGLLSDKPDRKKQQDKQRELALDASACPDLDALNFRARLLNSPEEPDSGRTDAGNDTGNKALWQEAMRFPANPIDTDDSNAVVLLEVSRGRNHSNQGDRAIAARPQRLAEHHDWTASDAGALVHRLDLPDWLANDIVKGAGAHDAGKSRTLWQDAMGAERCGRPYAKTARAGNGRLLGGYRHEFGSVLDFVRGNQGAAEERPLLLHLIAAHHGRARPIIEPNDPDIPPSLLPKHATDVLLRFGQLSEQYGPWHLAWLECLLRAADHSASRRLDEDDREGEQRDG